MQRRVKQADTDRQTLHDAEQIGEIRALHGQKPRNRFKTVFAAIGKDHFTHHGEPVALKEHVFGAAQTDPLRFKVSRHGRVRRRIRVGAHTDIAHAIGPVHELQVPPIFEGREHFPSAHERLPRRAIDGDQITLLERAPIFERERARPGVDPDRGAHHTGHAHPTRNNRCVRGDPAALGQNAHRAMHAPDILGRGFAAHEHTGFFARLIGLRRRRAKDNAAHRPPRRSGNPARNHLTRRIGIDLRVQ